MTAQISDFIVWNRDEWSICALENEWPFDPKEAFGIEPQMLSTACWRGYHCKYEITESQIFLSELCIGIKGQVPKIEGVEGRKDKYRGVVYKGLHFPVEYSGGVILGKGFMNEFYVHMGFHRPHCYEKVFELFVENGKLLGSEDCTSKMEKIRDIVRAYKEENSSNTKPTKEEISSFVEEAFSLDYSTKKNWI